MAVRKADKKSAWVACPKCWQKMKKDNLPKHMRKVHGIKGTTNTYAPGRKGKPFPIGKFAVTLAITIVVILIVFFSVDRYLLEKEGPVFSSDREHHDFGIIKGGKVWTNFTISNDGGTTLEITDIETSCDCTQVYFTYKGEQSPVFKKENNPEYKLKVDPDSSAQLSVSFDSDMYYNTGPVYRNINMKTNDPDHKEVTLVISANVNR